MKEPSNTTRVQTVVVGGGQAGLAVGHELARRGVPFLILDASARVGDAWRNRWDSLRLFTPARYCKLPGMRFPARGDTYPDKDQLADYLEAYARHFRLPIRSGVRVERIERDDSGFALTAGGARYACENVIVAMADHQVPHVPAFARELGSAIVQLHSCDYRNPSQLAPGGVLVVGAGNSGADIALELARTHRVWMAGKESGHVPFDIETPLARHLLIRLMRFVGHHVLTMDTGLGRKLRPKLLRQAAPFVRVKPHDLLAAGVERVARVERVRDGLPMLADGRALEVTNVVWCTGFEHRFDWIDLPAFDADGRPRHERGIVPDVPGLYFLGLHFLYAMTSATLFGIGRDARRIAGVVAARAGARRSRDIEAMHPAGARGAAVDAA